jgi:hypothetical protein
MVIAPEHSRVGGVCSVMPMRSVVLLTLRAAQGQGPERTRGRGNQQQGRNERALGPLSAELA